MPRKVPKGRTKLKEAWAHYKPAAHLWAAYRHRCFMGQPSPFFDFDEDAFLSFLLLAESYRSFGIQHVPRDQEKLEPTLLSDETWKVFVPGDPPFPPEDTYLLLPFWSADQEAFWGLHQVQRDALKKYGRKR